MTVSVDCQRLVVVHGPTDPILESTLRYVGLRIVHADLTITVWAPETPGRFWTVPADLSDGYLGGEDGTGQFVRWAIPDWPFDCRDREYLDA